MTEGNESYGVFRLEHGRATLLATFQREGLAEAYLAQLNARAPDGRYEIQSLGAAGEREESP